LAGKEMKKIIILFLILFAVIGFVNSDAPAGNVIAVKKVVVDPSVRGPDSSLSATAYIRNYDAVERLVDVNFYIADKKGFPIGGEEFEESFDAELIGAGATLEKTHVFDKTVLTFELDEIENYYVVAEAYLDESEGITEEHLYDNSRKTIWTNAVKRTPGFPEANHLSLLIVLLAVSLIIFYRKNNSWLP